MASCKLGHVYIVQTTLTKPKPKAKFAICVCAQRGYFVWLNSNARQHGKDQLPVAANSHSLLTRDGYLDLSRIVFHPENELENAKEHECISDALCKKIIDAIDAGLFVMVPAHAKLIRENLDTLLQKPSKTS